MINNMFSPFKKREATIYQLKHHMYYPTMCKIATKQNKNLAQILPELGKVTQALLACSYVFSISVKDAGAVKLCNGVVENL